MSDRSQPVDAAGQLLNRVCECLSGQCTCVLLGACQECAENVYLDDPHYKGEILLCQHCLVRYCLVPCQVQELVVRQDQEEPEFNLLDAIAHTRAVVEKIEKRLASLSRCHEKAKAYLRELEQLNGNNSRSQPTQFERIAWFLKITPGPQTLKAIEAGTGIRRSSLAAVLYRTHPAKFVSTKLPGSNTKGWQLRQETT